jgi:hypothetical protein
MSLNLPYRFDTSPVVKLILRGVLGLFIIVIVPGIGYSLLVSHDRAAVAHLLITGAIVMYIGRIFIKNLEGTSGTITADHLVVEPGTLYGTSLRGPRGRFPIQRSAGSEDSSLRRRAARCSRASDPGRQGGNTRYSGRPNLR